MAVTRASIPVRVWTFPGNASDTSLLEGVKADLRDWQLGRVVWVVDRGFASADNRRMLQRGGHHWIMGEKLRAGGANHEALARAGRYKTGPTTCRSRPSSWTRARSASGGSSCAATSTKLAVTPPVAHALARLVAELAAVAAKTGDARLRAEGELLAHPTLRRYLTRRGTKLVTDRAKARAEQQLDGKFLLSCSDDTLPAADVALGYKQLLEVERGWRDLKQILELRPVYHRLEERIRAHVLLCWLALLLIRVAETTCNDTWRNLRRELERMHLGEFTGPAGHLTQRTEPAASKPRSSAPSTSQNPHASTTSTRPRAPAPPPDRPSRAPSACRHYTFSRAALVPAGHRPHPRSVPYQCRTRETRLKSNEPSLHQTQDGSVRAPTRPRPNMREGYSRHTRLCHRTYSFG